MSTERYSRQSFLGADAEERIARCVVGIVGLGGGGSHLVQQLAHIGFQRYVLYDADVVEESNLNRLVGAANRDLPMKPGTFSFLKLLTRARSRRKEGVDTTRLISTSKLELAKRMILSLQPHADINGIQCKWQESPEALRQCHIVFGCVDSYLGRHELEIACRRYLMHYIDIGMDVHGSALPVIGGQVILSSPGGPCMRCMGFLTDKKLGLEAEQYGKAGARPQVIWPNGTLASAAVGLGMDLVTNWTRKNRTFAYLAYDGNEGTLKESMTLRGLDGSSCRHFDTSEVGDPKIVEL